MEKRVNSQDDLFKNASVAKAFFVLTLPVVFGKISVLVYNMADTWFIARTENTALIAGVSLVAPIFTVMIALGDILGVGGSSLISRLFGAGEDKKAKSVSSFCFLTALLLGILLMLVLIIFENPILKLLGANEETWQYAAEYYKWLVYGAPFVVCGIVPMNLFCTEGLATASMMGSIVGSAVNIILDPVLIFGCNMGAAGAAIATVIGNIASMVVYVALYLGKAKKISIHPKYIAVKAEEIKGVLTVGFPASITNFIGSVGLVLLNQFILAYGVDKVAALGIALKVNMIVIMILVGFSFGAQPLFGYCYGAGDLKRYKSVVKFAYGFECTFSGGLALVLGVLATHIMYLFVEDVAVIEAGTMILRWYLAGTVFGAVCMLTTCMFQAIGRAFYALLLSVCRQGVIFAIVLVIASKVAGYYGVIASQFIADALTAALALFLLGKTLKSTMKAD